MTQPFSSPAHLRPRSAAVAASCRSACKCLAVLFALAGFGASAVSAMVYAPISDADLFAGADRVVVGEVLEVRPADDARTPSTDYVIWVEEEFRSTTGLTARTPTVTVRVQGGVGADGLAFWIPGTPTLRVGERFVFFLSEAANADPQKAATDGAPARLSQHTLSLFHIVEAADRKLAVRALGDAAKIYLADTAKQGAKGLSRSVESFEEWPRDLGGFLSWMRAGAKSGDGAGRNGYDRYKVDPTTLGSAFGDKFTLLLSRADNDFGGCGDTGGHPIRRFDFDEDDPPPVGWRAHVGSPPAAIPAFREALESWTNDPASTVNFAFDGLTSSSGVLHNSDDTNTLRFNDPFDDIPGVFDGSGLLAIGGPWFYCELFEFRGEPFHIAVEGDIVVQDGVPEALAETPWPHELMVQLFAHELGHTLGIGHSDDPQALMQASLHLDPRGAAFEPDDLAALEYLYRSGASVHEVPGIPERPQVTTGRGPFVRLSWTPVPGAANYRIEKRRALETWAPLTTVVGTEFEDLWVDPETIYRYRLRAQNAAGASLVSLFARVATGPDGTPLAPSQLRAYPTDPRGVGLRWQSNSCDVETQRLAVDLGDGYQTLVAFIGGERTELLVTGLRSADAYGFQLTAENQWGESPPSEPVVLDGLLTDGSCTWQPGDEHLCLDNRRLQVSMEYWDGTEGVWLPAMPRPEEHRRGFFSFFDINNLEIELSIGTNSAGERTLRWTSLTGLPWRIEVMNTVTGNSWTYAADSSMCIGSMPLAGAGPADPDSPGPDYPGPDVPSSPVLSPATSPAKSGLAIADSGWQLVDVSYAPEKVSEKILPPEIPCTREPTELYLDSGRFVARLWWWDEEGVQRAARAFDLTDLTGGFELTTNDQLGWLVKMIDGRGFNDKYWLFAGPMHAGAPYEAMMEVEDLENGVTRTYRRSDPAPGEEPPACSVGDIGAFDG